MFDSLKNYFKNKKLSKQTIETKEWSFKNRIYMAKVVAVYDGDTIRAVFKFNGDYYKFNIRLMGIDTPEIRTKNDKEKNCGYMVKGILEDKILNKQVQLVCTGEDSFGRILAYIYYDGINISQYMLDNKYAYPYDGKKKTPFEELEDYYKHLL